MNNTEYENLYNKLDEYVRTHVGEHRYEHTLGVLKSAEKYARKYGADVQKAKIAAIFHDACKNDVGGLEHGEAAAKLIQTDFGVDDPEIINAIANHTIGRVGMGLLEKIIKMADLLEDGRTYEDVPEIRKYEETHNDIDGTCLRLLYRQREFLISNGIKYDKKTDDVIVWFEGLIERNIMTDREKAYLIANEMDARKAEDIVLIDIGEKSGFADYFVICTAKNLRQLSSLADNIDERLAKEEVVVNHIEGKGDTGWILMDYGDVIVHLFTEEQRQHYNIEKLWSDCEKLEFKPVGSAEE